MSKDLIEILYPNLTLHGYTHTSNEDTGYNCYAHALRDDKDWYSYLPLCGYYWPPPESEVPSNLRLSTFIKLFNYEAGFIPCNDGNLEEGFEKVALYVNANEVVKHAARQLPDGQWTSKLCDLDDVTHELRSLEDLGTEKTDFGVVRKFLKRSLSV